MYVLWFCSGSSEVCRQCMECGVKYGQRKKTRDLIAWAKKKRRHIKREELLAFLLDKPYPDPSSTDRVEDFADLSVSHQRSLAPTSVSGLNCLQGPCYSSNSLPSPRRRALFRDDSCVLSDSELFGVGRKRPSSSTSIPFEFGSDTPMVKRMRLWVHVSALYHAYIDLAGSFKNSFCSVNQHTFNASLKSCSNLLCDQKASHSYLSWSPIIRTHCFCTSTCRLCCDLEM